MADGSRRLIFVTPRYGADVVGGSEAVMREAAHGLAARGWQVEVATTCARNHYTWDNEYPEGAAETGGLVVRRFPIVKDAGLPVDRGQLEQAIARRAPLTPDEQLWWVNGLFRVPALFEHLLREADQVRATVLSPYLFWTTIAGATVAPERTIVMPCLHDEPYAYLPLFPAALGGVARHWYLSDPERDLAARLGLAPPQRDVVGAGVHIPAAYAPEKARARLGHDRPFVLYAGRREGGKGWDDLLTAFAVAVDRGADLDLVTMGVGDATPPPALRDRVHDLGFVSEDEVPDWFAAATAYVQPSRNESFSRTIMEAWLAGTPVLANRESAVVAWHCERSGAGLLWRGVSELAAALELVAAAPGGLRDLARPGRAYVLEHYDWPVVLDRMEKSLEAMPWTG